MDVAKGSSTAIGLRAIPVGSSLSKVGKERKVEVSARLVERKSNNASSHTAAEEGSKRKERSKEGN